MSDFVAAPVTYEMPVSAPIELFPPDATIDEFKVDEALRPAMRQAISQARVVTKHGRFDVWLKAGTLPMPLAVDILLKQGVGEEKVCSTLIVNEVSPRWWRFTGNRPPSMIGTVDVHLRPSQDAADGRASLGTYWGEEVVIPGVVIDAPYTPKFLEDEATRPAVEKALAETRIVRGGNGLTVSLDGAKSPVKLAYDVTLAGNGRQYHVDSCWVVIPRSMMPASTYACDDIDLAHQASECEVIFRPSSDWEVGSFTLDPPWGGELRLRVKIESAQGPSTRP
jgi:hypothetical protein